MPHHLRSAVFQAGCAPPGPRGPPCRCCSTRRWTCAASPRRSPTPTACASRRPTPAAPCAYLNGADPAHPDVSPLLDPDPRGLPPAVIATAEYDRLRPQAERHAARLRAAGVPVALVTGTGLDHGFLGWGAFARRPAEAVAEIGAAVHDALTRAPVD